MFDDRPWLAHYAPHTPADVDIPEQTVTRLVLDAAERWPDRVAVDFFGATTTFAQVCAEVSRAASALRELGVRPGDRVSLVLPNCTTHLIAFHAVLGLGAIAVEHNPTYSTEELHDQFLLAEPAVVLVWRNRAADAVIAARDTSVRAAVSVDVARDLPVGSQLALRLPLPAARRTRSALTGGNTACAADWRSLLRSAPDATVPDLADPDDTALLLFTGGTTGTPKCAELSHRNLLANVLQGQAWADFRPGEETVFGMLPFFHAFGMLFCLVLPAHIGATLVAFPNFDPAAVVKAHRRRPATFIPGVAPMFSRLLDAADRVDLSLSSVRLAFSGAMPLSTEVSRRWETATGGLLIEGYGMSECSPIALGNPCTADRRPGTLGIPFPNTRLRVTDQDDPDTEAGPDASGVVRGELQVSGPQVFRGYWHNPQETASVLRGGWLRTGDIVEVDPGGHARLVDRVKEMINVGGFKVFPSQVEAHLRTMSDVGDVAVVGVPRDPQLGGEEVAAVIVPAGDHRPTLAEVREFALTRLPHYAVPHHVHHVDELPVSMIGKVLRRVVRDNLIDRSDDQRDHQP